MAKHVPSPRELFDKALEISSAPDRKAYLDRVCADAPEVRQKVEALLKAHEEAGSFMASDTPKQSTKADSKTISFEPGGAEAPPSKAPGAYIGRYKLIEKIGEGGMGAVYRAEQEKPVRRQVALKIIKPGMDSAQVVARFEAERQALTMMDHLSIARVLDAGATKNGLPYFVMELVRGVPLTRFCDDSKMMVRQRLELFVQVCHAIQHAHQKGIIHRDIKPSNCLVTMYEGKPIPKVIDFGLAKAIGGQQLTEESASTQFGAILGTLAYMSPEQAQFGAQDIDTRTDVYALGVMLFELLTGTIPLDRSRLKGASGEEILRRIREEEPPRPSARLSELGAQVSTVSEQRRTKPDRLAKLLRGELDWIVMRALDKDRNRRYETALDFAKDVQSYLDDEPVKACPPSARYRLGKFARKHRALLIGAGAGAFFLVVTLLVLLVSNQRVTTALAAETKALTEKTAALEDKTKALTEKSTLLTQARQMFSRSNDLIQLALPKHTSYGDVEKAKMAKLLEGYQSLSATLGDSREGREIAAEGESVVARFRAYLGDLDPAKVGLQRAAELYKSLADSYPEQPEYRYHLAQNKARLGDTQRMLGQWREARSAFREASSLATHLVADFPTKSLYRFGLAESQHGLGLLALDLSEWDQAREAFQEAIVSWEKLVADSPGDRANRFNLAVGYNVQMLVLNELKMSAEMEKAYAQVAALLKKLELEAPNSLEFRFLQAQSYNNLGLILCNSQQWVKAEEAFKQAIQLGTAFTAQYPALPEFGMELARSQFNLGWCLKQQDKEQAAEAAYRQAIGLGTKLAAASPKVPRYRSHLAGSYNNLGELLSEKKPAEAKRVYDLAIRLGDKLTKDFPDAALCRINLGGTCSNLANVLRDEGKPLDALQWYDKAIALLGAGAQAQPVPNARLFLRNVSWDRANALGQLGRHAEAVKDWERAISLDDGIDRDALKSFLATAQAELKLKKGAPAAADLCYEAARTYAQGAKAAADKNDPSLRTQYARRALELLKEANSAGYFQERQRVEQLDKEPAFNSLRKGADFQKFVAELARGKK